jgi:hypothetical protein
LLNFITTLTSIVGFITALVGVIFAMYLPWATYPSGFTQGETIHSWTCKWESLDRAATTGQDGQSLYPPAGFHHSCLETRAGFILLGLLVGLEILMGAAATAGWWLEHTVTKQRKTEGFELGKY